MPFKLSPSKLNLLDECPRCFWLHSRKGIKRPSMIFPSLPSGMDKVLKKHFDSFRDKGELPPELEENNIKAKLFNNVELLKKWRNHMRGLRWKDENGNVLMGAVDNILQKDGKLIVLDYKTRGFPLKEGTADFYQDQLDIYTFLLRKNGFETKDYAYLLFYYPDKVNKTGEVLFDTELVKMKVSVEDAQELFERALKILNGEMPEPSEDCEFCKWNKINV